MTEEQIKAERERFEEWAIGRGARRDRLYHDRWALSWDSWQAAISSAAPTVAPAAQPGEPIDFSADAVRARFEESFLDYFGRQPEGEAFDKLGGFWLARTDDGRYEITRVDDAWTGWLAAARHYAHIETLWRVAKLGHEQAFAECQRLATLHAAPADPTVALRQQPEAVGQGPRTAITDAVEQEIVNRYIVERRTGGGFWSHCVRAVGGTREIFIGHKRLCENVRAALETACHDGAFMMSAAGAAPVEPGLLEGMVSVPCAAQFDPLHPQSGWLFIPHADGNWVSLCKLPDFSRRVIEHWRDSLAPPQAAPGCTQDARSDGDSHE